MSGSGGVRAYIFWFGPGSGFTIGPVSNSVAGDTQNHYRFFCIVFSKKELWQSL